MSPLEPHPEPARDVRDLTADQLESVVIAALEARDFRAVDGALRLLATKDAYRAESILETMRVGLELRGKSAR